MGGSEQEKPVFAEEHILNKKLVLKMLQYEDKLYLSDVGQSVLSSPGMSNIYSLEAGKTIQRMTLDHFGFSTSDESVANYRLIFSYYWRSAADYDHDVLSSVFYMRENRCLYYTDAELVPGDSAPNCTLYELDSTTQTSLHEILAEEPEKTTIVAAYSAS